ncbi:MAG: amino acid permease [Verrucomicrobia bacterium]|nr:amino acid permease [Verrucomicrobiota bacterium]
MKNKIPFFSLVLLIVAAIDSIRTLPTTAFFGTSLIFFYLLAAVFFLFPVAFISAEFSSRYDEEGGIFHWIRHAFGDKIGLLAVWLQWINTMVWYPTMLLFISGTTIYIADATIVHHKTYLLATSLFIFWSLTLLNLRGIHASTKISLICGTIGTLFPMIFLMALGIGWLFSGHSLAIAFSWRDFFPSENWLEASNCLTTIMASLLGMELAGVHVKDIQNPQKNFPLAIGCSVLILLVTLILSSLSIAIVIPKQDIDFVDGVMQTFRTFLSNFGLLFMMPLLALCIVLGATGGSVNWLLSPAKGLLQAAEHGFLPSYFLIKNSHEVPYRILILQALLVSLFSFAIHFVSNINSYYWFLMALSTGLYMLMYILLFLAALKLKRPAFGYKIPKGLRTISCFAGCLACIMTIIIGLLPPSGVVIKSKVFYSFFVICGFGLMLFPAFLLWRYREKNQASQVLKKPL